MSTSQSEAKKNDTSAATETLVGRTLQASFTVKDLKKSLAWYRDVIGFTVSEEHVRDGQLRAVSLQAGDVRILIGQDDGAKGFDRVKGQGFSIMITTTGNVDRIADGIRRRGGTLVSGPTDMPWGARLFRIQDPDGFAINIASMK